MCHDGDPIDRPQPIVQGGHTMAHPLEEVRATVDAYVAVRERIEAGDATWLDLADFFTDDVVYIDPAWGRVQGIDHIREFLVDSMVGLEDWSFPIEFTAIDGDTVVIKWWQQLPGRRPDGTRYQQSGISTLVYAGDGKFSYEEDLLNMTHVLEDLAASGWRPNPGFNSPPAEPDRNFARP
jgi:ketosteroid isomerase-like protein